jgi:4-hydroxybutyrate dehydrogenase
MRQLKLSTELHEYNNITDFIEDFKINRQDLILTNRYICNDLVVSTGCHFLYLEDYGSGEPSDQMINRLMADYNRFDCDRIVAIGGGSIMDVGKVLSVCDKITDVNELYADMSHLQKIHKLICVPTTCGTGSEVTNIAIVNRTVISTKQGLVNDCMYPDHAVMIPDLLNSLPYEVFATSSIDALVHAVESYLSPYATDYTKMFSAEAIRKIISSYQKIGADRNAYKTCFKDILIASNYAGIAFGNAGVGLVHAMSYAFGGKYHVPHGESNYQFFLPVLQFYKECKPDGLISDIEKMCDELLYGTGLSGLEDLLEKVLHKKPMHEYGADEQDIVPFTQSTIDNQQRLLSKSYLPVEYKDIEKIYRICL